MLEVLHALLSINENFSAFLNNGFTVGYNSGWYVNGTPSGSSTQVAWNWNAGDTDGKTYTVTVVSDSGNKYRFDGFGTSAVTLDLAEGGTYIFNMDDSSNATHPFSIGTAANGTVYTSGITYFLDGVSKTYSQYTSGFASATTRRLHITVPASAPVLYYWCSVHSGMGGQINTNSTLGSSNFDGTIQSTVKANLTAGFSIVSYTGNETAGATFGHGLGIIPRVVLVKRRAASEDWIFGVGPILGSGEDIKASQEVGNRAQKELRSKNLHLTKTQENDLIMILGIFQGVGGMAEPFKSAVIRLTDVQACETVRAKIQTWILVKLCLRVFTIPPCWLKN